jgi:16S rRNA (guanine527-N7)-methyltransferase
MMAPTDGRIQQLLQPFLGGTSITASQLHSLQIHLGLLLKWNAKINLTAVRDPEQMVVRHFGESLFAARVLFPSGSETGSVIDLGSGAGFPGIPIKVWASSSDLTLIESNQRKATFLREVVRAAGLQGVEVQAVRAEVVKVKAALVTLRAVEKFESILSAAVSLVAPAGRLALLVSMAQVDVASSVAGTLEWERPVRIPESKSRCLLIGNVH